MTEADSLAHVLLRLVLAAPIARCRAPKSRYEFLQLADPNIAVMATATGRERRDIEDSNLAT